MALVPARAGSQRVPDKNVRRLAGHPLLAYAVSAARDSGLFEAVVLSTDSSDYARVGEHYGAHVPFLRPAELAGDRATDVEWIDHALRALQQDGAPYDAFAILRPTSPFRTAGTIQRAWRAFSTAAGADSLRAVERCIQHPGKMWRILGGRLVPVLPVQPDDGVPWHSRPTQSLPAVWVQNASLEIAWSSCVLEQGSIAGEAVVPFLTEGLEGVDINHEQDWAYAEQLAQSSPGSLAAVERPPWRPAEALSGQHEEMPHG